MGIPDPDPVKGFVNKCNLCAERAREDLLPACVELCPTGAIEYGDLDEISKKVKSRSVKLLIDKKLLLKKTGGG